MKRLISVRIAIEGLLVPEEKDLVLDEDLNPEEDGGPDAILGSSVIGVHELSSKMLALLIEEGFLTKELIDMDGENVDLE